MSQQHEMNIYVIAERGKDQLDSPIFHAGSEQEEEAIAVFTTRERAEQYIQEAQWSGSYDVGELRPLQVLKWFQTAHDEGVHMVAINPDPSWANLSTREEVLSLEDPAEAFSQLLRAELVGDS